MSDMANGDQVAHRETHPAHPAGTRSALEGASHTSQASSIEELQLEVQQLRTRLAAQQHVIDALVESAERGAESVARLGTQHIVEQRTAHLNYAKRVLRSVIEALDGALCIVGADGTVLDANGRWLHGLLPDTRSCGHAPDNPTHHAGDPAADRFRGGDTATQAPAPGTIGSNFFAWCRTAHGMQDLLAEAATVVRDIISTDRPTTDDEATPGTSISGERSVKGRVTLDGAERWIVVRVHPIRDHDDARAVVSLIDITDPMRIQEQLRQATEEAQRLALVARATDSAVVITLPGGSIEWVNDPFTRRTGYSLAEAIGRPRRDLVHGGCQDSAEFAAFLARIARGEGADGEFPMTSRHGDRYWANIQVRPVLDGGKATHMVWVEQDVTARRQTQHRLREEMTRAERLATALSQEKTLLTGVITAIPQLVFWKDRHGRYLGCNAAYLAFRGVHSETDMLGQDEASLGLDDAMTQALHDLEAQVIASGQPLVNRKMDLTDNHGQLRALLLSVLPLAQGADGARGVIGVGADITHARELERQLAQANRLESIGQLAAGIAHEINTPIQYISDNTRFVAEATSTLLGAAQHVAALADSCDAGNGPMAQAKAIMDALELDFLGQEIPNALTESRDGLTRVTEIVRAMKDYAHPGSGRNDTDVNRAIESTVQVCRNEWKYIAQVHLDLAPNAGLAPCFEGELKQVILNMIVNAAHAIDEDRARPDHTDLGNITISTRREAEHFVITIADDGPGMDEKVRHRVFDPFFTTKQVGKGTGQGLSLAHAVIVTKHHGRIDLDTAPGHGATFTLHLPLNPPETGTTPTSDPTATESDPP
jgi:two-component system NtrC family sensor kinase